MDPMERLSGCDSEWTSIRDSRQLRQNPHILTIHPRRLINYDPALEAPVSSMTLGILPEAPPSINCFQALDYL